MPPQLQFRLRSLKPRTLAIWLMLTLTPLPQFLWVAKQKYRLSLMEEDGYTRSSIPSFPCWIPLVLNDLSLTETESGLLQLDHMKSIPELRSLSLSGRILPEHLETIVGMTDLEMMHFTASTL